MAGYVEPMQLLSHLSAPCTPYANYTGTQLKKAKVPEAKKVQWDWSVHLKQAMDARKAIEQPHLVRHPLEVDGERSGPHHTLDLARMPCDVFGNAEQVLAYLNKVRAPTCWCVFPT
jgi:hypothetical protein